MRIGIITQPLTSNYGGLLQNFALQTALKRLGHEVYTIDRVHPNNIYSSRIDKYIVYYIKQMIRKCLRMPYAPTKKQKRTITVNCTNFVDNNIQRTNVAISQKDIIKTAKKYKFNAFIVGSDQVWRPMYSPSIKDDYLEFSHKLHGVKRISYAASFGVDKWEYNDEQTSACSRLAKSFDAISVRETSGIELCHKYLDVDAQLVIDPTFLLEKEDYIELVEKAKEKETGGNLFCYILDNNTSINNVINNIEKKLSLTSFQVKANKNSYTLKPNDKIKDFVIPAPTKWLRGFMDAKIIFTNSFHGCVFSIIFNKPFWVIGNKKRGNARFDSLLKLFDLEERRINLDDIENTDLSAPIDWEKVNIIKKIWKEKSLDFIKKNL